MKRYLLTIWGTLDPIYYNFTRLHHVADHERNKTIFRVRLTKYKGSSVVLKDGTMIHKHDLLLKIHLHNVRMIRELKDVRSEVQRALLLYHMVRDDLRCLSRYIAKHPKRHEIKAIIGITMLNKGTRRLGFETFSIQNRYYRLFKQLTCLLINFIANSSNGNPPVYLFMSTNQLLNHSKI
ncbi:YkoP family protein [Lentibacillus salinarum]|uniref:YkoP-like domain-containing protein n=1 Tax=Lentibacillus salinarum TaxID=446820 RepID=A0ABW3ZV45_9BACI